MCPIPPSPLSILQESKQGWLKPAVKAWHSSGYRTVLQGRMVRTEHTPVTGHLQQPPGSLTVIRGKGHRHYFVQVLFHVGICYHYSNLLFFPCQGQCKSKSFDFFLRPFGPCSTSYACSDVLHLNPRTSGNGKGKSRTPMPHDLLCSVCSLQKLLFLAFTTLKENTLHFAENWTAEGKYTQTHQNLILHASFFANKEKQRDNH